MSSEQRSSSEMGRQAKGILKPSKILDDASAPAERPALTKGLSEKEVTQMNTELNAGSGHRRNSSNARRSLSRRQSGAAETDPAMRLQWDEANLYMNEGQMGGKMKIDEPKTPYAPGYDPSKDADEDDDDVDPNELDPTGIVVDELDSVRGRAQKKQGKGDDIPGLDLGEPEIQAPEATDGEKRVILDPDQPDDDDGRHSGDESKMTTTEREAHKRFEMMRKKHYEMKNVKELLAHSSEPDDDEDEGEDDDDDEVK